MKIERVLERQSKRIAFVVDGTTLTQRAEKEKATTETFGREPEAVMRMIELTRTKIAQGWIPVTPAKDVGAYVKALDERVSMWEWIVALTEDEVAVAYANAMKSEQEVSIEVLRRRPTRALFAWMLTRFDDYYEDDWTKAVKFLSKTPSYAAWIREELEHAITAGTLPGERAKKFAARNAKKIAAGPMPEPVKPSAPVGDEMSLLALIAKTPNDDAPRLVYADWLLEHGFGFGEFIEVSCRLAPLSYGDAAFDELSDRAKKLENKHAKAWLEPIRPFIRSWGFERGMISRLTCDAALFTQAGAAIALRAPRGSLELTGLKKKDIAALAKTPLGAFEFINLQQQRIDDEGIALIAASPTIAGASCWRLDYNPFKDDGVIAIASSRHFSSVNELTLRLQFTARGFEALLASPHLTSLRDLSASIDRVGNAFRDCKLALESLSVYVDALSHEDVEALAKVKSFANLTYLELGHTQRGTFELDGDDVLRLLDAFPRLKNFSTSVTLKKSTQKLIEARASAQT